MSFDLAGRRVIDVIAGNDDDDDSNHDEELYDENQDDNHDIQQLPVVENTSLMNQEGRMGDIYRQIRNSLAERRAAAAAGVGR
jgi:hypothetical protein